MNDSIEVEQTRKVGNLSVSVRIRYETTGRIDIPTRAAELKAVATDAVWELGKGVEPDITPRTGDESFAGLGGHQQ